MFRLRLAGHAESCAEFIEGLDRFAPADGRGGFCGLDRRERRKTTSESIVSDNMQLIGCMSRFGEDDELAEPDCFPLRAGMRRFKER